jgi:hypothetical protein
VVLPGNVVVPGLLPAVLGFVNGFAPWFVPGFVNGLVPWFVPGFVNGLVLWFVPGLVKGLLAGLPNGLLVETVGEGVPKPVFAWVGPAVAELMQRPNWQTCPMPHMLVHEPQLSRSLERSAHPAKQEVSP